MSLGQKKQLASRHPFENTNQCNRACPSSPIFVSALSLPSQHLHSTGSLRVLHAMPLRICIRLRYIHSTHMTTSVLVLPCMQPYTITSASGLGFPDQLRAARVDVPDLILPPWLAVPSKRQLPIRPGLCRTSPDHAGGDLDCSARACPWSTTRGSPPMGSRSCAGLSSIIHIGSRRLPYHSTHLNTTLLPYSMCNFTNTRGSPQGGYETSGSPGKSREFR